MLHKTTIRNDGFNLNKALQHCCNIFSSSYNIVPTCATLCYTKSGRCESSRVLNITLRP